VVGAAACGDDEPPPATTTTSTTEPAGESLGPWVLEASDLPPGFSASGDADDTITAFCAGEDATAGLRASAREVTAFTRDPAGASVIQLVFRFEDDGAAAFVRQADEILDRCSDVPDATGLAFAYEPTADAVAAPLEAADATTSRFGTSAGSGDLIIDVAVFQHGDVAQLVAILGLELPRAELDALAASVFEAAVTRAGAATDAP